MIRRFAAGGSGAVDGTWVTMTPLSSGWTAVSGHPPQYMKDSRGIVHLRGQVTGNTDGAGMFTLPAGYTPAAGVVYEAGQVAPNNGYINGAGVVSPKGQAGVAGDVCELGWFVFPTVPQT